MAPSPTSGSGRLWSDPEPATIPPALAAAVGGHPLVARTLVRRGCDQPAAAASFLLPDRYRPTPGTDLPGMEVAVERMAQAVDSGEAILVWGDFDADGQTSTTVLVSTLRDLGGQVRYHIPDRAEGHGIDLARLASLLDSGPGLVVTCDTGIAAHDAVALARGRGVDVIVTDHHDPTEGVPPALAVLNPKLLDDAHPLRELPGVGVAYKLAECLYMRAGRPEGARQLLDLVAIGIVADVALLVGDTRYLLQLGLEELRDSRRPGLQALLREAHLASPGLTEEHIGYMIAPRLNSMGRMANAQVAVEFLTTTDAARARILALEIEGLNMQRKIATDRVTEGAEALLERQPELLEDPVLMLGSPHWPGGIVGIVAGRLAEKYNRPAILLTTPPGEPARGSCRSVPGCSIVDALAANAGLLRGYGGHPMAAGLSVDADRLPELRRAMARTIRDQCGDAAPPPPLAIDGFVPLAATTLELAGDLSRLAPFGAGNPSLILAAPEVTARQQRRIGRDGAHRRVTLADSDGVERQAIWWNGGDAVVPEGRFDLAYNLRINDYRGRREVQLEWLDWRQSVPETIRLASAAPAPTIVDHREAIEPRRILDGLRQAGALQVWAEAVQRAEVDGVDRTQLSPGRVMAIWTPPPGPRELREAVSRVRPEVVHLFAVDASVDGPAVFLRRLAGLVKRVLSETVDGTARTSVSGLASATAQRAATVQAGLWWLVQRGDVSADTEGDDLTLSSGSGLAIEGLAQFRQTVSDLLAETRAYREYFANADEGVLAEAFADALLR